MIVLGEGGAAFTLDLLHRQRPVRAAARQDHADGVGALVFGQGFQQIVDGHGGPAGFRPRSQRKVALDDPHAGVGRDDVDMIRHYADAFRCFHNHHRGFFAEDFDQHTRMVRV